MLSSVFSAFSFLPFDKVFDSQDKYAAFLKKLEADTTLEDTEAHKKQLAYLRQWIARAEHAHIEYVL